ncbi:MAG: two-component sensor histidine kinase [Planctomycetes bacterium]|nr:two-component sensor histidine kinase [Planctomycetota bacterium]NBY02563.1 two-component sensor histidine kinase [Planctomycetota bacterium]
MNSMVNKNSPTPWDLDAEAIVVKIRWFGVLIGYFLVNSTDMSGERRLLLNAILAIGVAYTLLDTYFSWKKKVFLAEYPLFIAAMESLFIGMLCYYEEGLSSTFRYYYFLSILCCALRYSWKVTAICFTFHCISYGALFFLLNDNSQSKIFISLTMIIMGWLAWASTSLTSLLRKTSSSLEVLNAELLKNQSELEARIAERSKQLQEAQAQVLQQEKMAAFGLLAAGIAHEVGNPLTSISSMVQILQKKELDDYTREKLDLMSGQLTRIRDTLREVMDFSRPANLERKKIKPLPVIEEAMNIAKYYKRTRGKVILQPVPQNLPTIDAIHDQLVQVILNLILNAIDAAGTGGIIEVELVVIENNICFQISDNGPGVAPSDVPKLFLPFFTTKKHGTGLGLFVSRKIVEEHGGALRFFPKSEGGSLFSASIPFTNLKNLTETTKVPHE